MDEYTDLFGAKPGRTTGIRLNIHLDHATGYAVIVLEVQAEMRQMGYELRIVTTDDRSPGAAIGLLAPMLHQGWYRNAETNRHHLWRLYDRLAADGYDVMVYNAGRNPRQH